MEYEAEFIDGVMVRHDASQLRLAALRCVGGRVGGCSRCAGCVLCALVSPWSALTAPTEQPGRTTSLSGWVYRMCYRQRPRFSLSGYGQHGNPRVELTAFDRCGSGLFECWLACALPCGRVSILLSDVAEQDATPPPQIPNHKPSTDPTTPFPPVGDAHPAQFVSSHLDLGGLRSDDSTLCSRRRKTPCRGCA